MALCDFLMVQVAQGGASRKDCCGAFSAIAYAPRMMLIDFK